MSETQIENQVENQVENQMNNQVDNQVEIKDVFENTLEQPKLNPVPMVYSESSFESKPSQQANADF